MKKSHINYVTAKRKIVIDLILILKQKKSFANMPVKLTTVECETTWNQRFQGKLGTNGEVLMEEKFYILEKK
jgi:hypothetical protein